MAQQDALDSGLLDLYLILAFQVSSKCSQGDPTEPWTFDINHWRHEHGLNNLPIRIF